jgi:hypothetical protein
MKRQKLVLASALIFAISGYRFFSNKEVSLSGDSGLRDLISTKNLSTGKHNAQGLRLKEAQLALIKKIDKDKIDYQVSAYELAKVLEKHKLDGDELNRLFNKLGKSEFLKQLPDEVRNAYNHLEEKIEVLQKNQQLQDGMHEKFFSKYKTEIPGHIKNQRDQLEVVQIPQSVSEIVSDVSSSAEVTNTDVQRILEACGKGNSNCINKSFAMIIESNHALDNLQLKRIQEYL